MLAIQLLSKKWTAGAHTTKPKHYWHIASITTINLTARILALRLSMSVLASRARIRVNVLSLGLFGMSRRHLALLLLRSASFLFAFDFGMLGFTQFSARLRHTHTQTHINKTVIDACILHMHESPWHNLVHSKLFAHRNPCVCVCVCSFTCHKCERASECACHEKWLRAETHLDLCGGWCRFSRARARRHALPSSSWIGVLTHSSDCHVVRRQHNWPASSRISCECGSSRWYNAPYRHTIEFVIGKKDTRLRLKPFPALPNHCCQIKPSKYICADLCLHFDLALEFREL